jgi:hypothetical protein
MAVSRTYGWSEPEFRPREGRLMDMVTTGLLTANWSPVGASRLDPYQPADAAGRATTDEYSRRASNANTWGGPEATHSFVRLDVTTVGYKQSKI